MKKKEKNRERGKKEEKRRLESGRGYIMYARGYAVPHNTRLSPPFPPRILPVALIT